MSERKKKWYGAAYGYEQLEPERPDWTARVRPPGMVPETKGYLRRARTLYSERPAEDFDFDGNGDAVERATGERYERARHDALEGDDETGVVCFVRRDGWILFMKPEAWEPRVRSVVMATGLHTAVLDGPRVADKEIY